MSNSCFTDQEMKRKIDALSSDLFTLDHKLKLSLCELLMN